ncbi:triphosphoribosyl-dephospho-CoA synthase, partial [Streptomyces milbemycinicus]|uniref:triphosphoribosyl-dephospho-CoA synthase n=1 Tax=Streptomyces milbemycinicus TaxID=476552 RepID=UPI00340B0AFC
MDDALAQAAVRALIAQAELTPKPGLADARDLRARTTGADLLTLRWSAKALTPAFAAIAASARRPGGPPDRARPREGPRLHRSERTLRRLRD